MSDYVRKKAVRYKIDENIIKNLQEKYGEYYLEDEWLIDYFYQNSNVKIVDQWNCKSNDIAIGSGLDFDNNEYQYFIDYVLDYEYGASGDFENVRELTEKEFEKYKEIFKDILPNLKPGELRFVHYCYYNGVDEPAVWNLEEI